jgi:GxxExxY protein
MAAVSEKIIYREESYAIVGACFEVYKELGNGFLEAVYQECLELEFSQLKIPYLAQPKLDVTYKGNRLNQHYQPDFLCFGKIILEIKAVKQLGADHRAQTINYLKASNKELALLINFGHYPRLEQHRYINKINK